MCPWKIRGAHHDSSEKKSQHRDEAKLIRAVQRGAYQDVRDILDKGTSVVCFDEKGTPLHYAVRGRNVTITNMLLEHGAPMNIFGETNFAPLHMAAKLGCLQIVESLIKHGARVDIESKFERKTPLHLASAMRNTKTIALLAESGADVNKADLYGTVPLHNAARGCHEDCVDLLLQSGCHVNEPDKDGWTALLLAAEGGYEKIVKLLLDKNGYVDTVNKYGRTALHWACAGDHRDTAEALLSKGANPNLEDSNGRTPAQCVKSKTMLDLLLIFGAQNVVNQRRGAVTDTIGDKILLAVPSDGECNKTPSEIVEVIKKGRMSIKSLSRKSQNSSIGVSPMEPFQVIAEELDFFRTDSGIHDCLDSTGTDMCHSLHDDMKHANGKYRSYVQLVNALLVVMEGKTEALTEKVLGVLEGNTLKMSYVDVLRELFGYLQTVDDSLTDFRRELVSGTDEVTKSMQVVMQRCTQLIANSQNDHDIMDHMGQIHFISSILAKYPGSWRMLHGKLMTSLSPEVARESRDHIEETQKTELHQAYTALTTWMKTRLRKMTSPADDIMTALESCDLEHKDELIYEIKCELFLRDSDNNSSVSIGNNSSMSISPEDSVSQKAVPVLLRMDTSESVS